MVIQLTRYQFMDKHNEMNSHLEIVKDHFEDSYQNYDRLITKLVPGYQELINSVLQTFENLNLQSDVKIIDMGCGTALLGECILERGTNYQYFGIDISGHMIREAQARLAKFKNRIKLINENFFNIGKFSLPKFAAVISMLAIHHFNNKQDVYKLAHSLLKSQQPFILADLVVDAKTNLAMRKFRKEHMYNSGLSEEEITRWFEIFDAEDNPSSISDNVSILERVGFHEIKKVWNNENYATIVAIK